MLLRRSRRQLYILGDRTLGYQRKVEALGGKHASKDSVGPFEIGARIMQKLVLVPYEKYQRLLDGKTMESSEKNTTIPPNRRERTVLKDGSTLGTG